MTKKNNGVVDDSASAETVRPPPAEERPARSTGTLPSATGIRLTADRKSMPPGTLQSDSARAQRTTLPEPMGAKPSTDAVVIPKAPPVAVGVPRLALGGASGVANGDDTASEEEGVTSQGVPLHLLQAAAKADAVEDGEPKKLLRSPSEKGRVPRQRSVTMEVNQKRQLGRYELAFELAQGGFAVVYLARVVGPGGFEKFVALKKIHSHLAQEKEFVDMFLDEARIAACINHPNVCPVFDFGEADGAYYLAMDYVFGEPFAAVMRALRKLPPERLTPARFPLIARILSEAADGLHAAHEATGPDGRPLHVVHRDVAPPNFFIRYDGHVQVVDFGIASAVGKLHMTATGVMKGHLSYVAPEQFNGGKVDRRTDIWGLGVMLWEMLAGRRLYRRDSDVKTMFAVLSEPLVPMRDIVADVPPALDAVVRKALAKNPNDRFQTAREMSQALNSYLQAGNTVVSSHEVAKWLQDLLPNAREQKTHIIDQARLQLEARRTGQVVPLARVDSSIPPEGADSSSSLQAQLEPQAPGVVSKRRLGTTFWVALGVALIAAAAVAGLRWLG